LAEAGMITGALWCDLDADGWPDLVLAVDWGHVRVLRNRKGEAFDEVTAPLGFASAGTGWWRSVAAGDFNGDARPDLVVGNGGLNTVCRASPESPALIFAGDLTGRGSHDLIEAYFESGVLYQRRSRREIAAANRFITLRFARNDLFAQAS